MGQGPRGLATRADRHRGVQSERRRGSRRAVRWRGESHRDRRCGSRGGSGKAAPGVTRRQALSARNSTPAIRSLSGSVGMKPNLRRLGNGGAVLVLGGFVGERGGGGEQRL